MRINTNVWNRVRYSLWAPFYDHIDRFFRRQRRRSFEILNLQPGERALIVGAGTGLDLDFIPAGVEVAAIDITPAMIERLRKRAARLGLPVDARVMDGQALEYPDASFDAVVLHLILAVIPDPVCCVRETARVLKRGGRAIIFDKFAPDSGRLPLLIRLLSPFANILATNVTRRLGPILEGSGLRIVHQEPAKMGGLFRIALLQKG